MLEMEFDAAARSLTCRFTERMDAVNSQTVDGLLNGKLGEPEIRQALTDKELRMVFDLARVDFLASAFLRVCLGTAKKLDQGRFCIVNSTPPIKKFSR